jgi:homeobox-leucine zipper protein
MGFDDVCNTGLVLGLGLTAATAAQESSTSKAAKKPCSNFEPSLTLGLSGESYQQIFPKKIDVNKGCDESVDLYRQASPHSAVSSFSSGRIKRERDLSSEEVEVERVSSRVSDEDEDGPNARKKLRLTKEQSALLEESFKQHSTLNPVIYLSRLFLLFFCGLLFDMCSN